MNKQTGHQLLCLNSQWQPFSHLVLQQTFHARLNIFNTTEDIIYAASFINCHVDLLAISQGYLVILC